MSTEIESSAEAAAVISTGAADWRTGRGVSRAVLLLLRGRTLIFLLLLVIVFGLVSSDYLTQSNLILMTKHVSVNAILAIGVTFVILTGGSTCLSGRSRVWPA